LVPEPETSRRTFFRYATLGIGAVIGAGLAVPFLRYLLYPVGRRVVSSPQDPVDIGSADAFPAGGPPVRVALRAKTVRDGWTAKRDVVVGAAWVARTGDGELRAFSSVCPHLGCAVDFDGEAGRFKCPCHTSAFARDGARVGGPSKRGLDPLPVLVRDGRVLVVYKRFKSDVSEREEV
jgi:menaquinol-cytochrome c reductase iron-sulfur subunit